MSPFDLHASLAGLDLGDAPSAPGEFETNAHIHLPPNFSSLTDADAAASRAAAEGVRVLGISNYYGTGVYPAFAAACLAHRVFPLIGLEVIVFDAALARAGTRVNDPQNPGKIYICGKGLGRIEPTSEALSLYAGIARLDNERASEILAKTSAHAAARGVPLDLDAHRVSAGVARRRNVPLDAVVLQERYLAQAVAGALDEGPADGRRARWLAVLGDTAASEIDAAAAAPVAVRDKALQDVVRKHLMKVGRPAHVEERYVDLDTAFRLIAAMDGISVYPILADGASPVCEFEESPEALADRLDAWGVRAVEYIPTRNRPATLQRYVDALDARGFFQVAGTEHNSPVDEPVAIRCAGGEPLPPSARRLFSRGACILAAHQWLRSRGETGVDTRSKPGRAELDRLAALGSRAIRSVVGS